MLFAAFLVGVILGALFQAVGAFEAIFEFIADLFSGPKH
jgi:hypothetical protein